MTQHSIADDDLRLAISLTRYNDLRKVINRLFCALIFITAAASRDFMREAVTAIDVRASIHQRSIVALPLDCNTHLS